MEIRRVAVIGAGPTGRRLAARFAGAGFAVILEDILPSNLRKAAAEFDFTRNETGEAQRTGGSIRFASSIEDAVRSTDRSEDSAVDLILDCVPDELESKLEIFSLLDRMAPPLAILVTPTKSLSIADLASCTYRAERCLAVKLTLDGGSIGPELGLVATTLTAPDVLQAVRDFWSRAGFAVVLEGDPAEARVIAGTLF